MTISKNPKTISVSQEIGGRILTLETGWVGKQAAGSIIVTYGETVVHAAVVDGGPKDLDFFPLTVDYREKTYAAGKIPGSFFRREGRPTTKEVLAGRMADRAVRPMFAEGYRNEVQIMISVLSYDQENEPEIPAMIATAAALHVSQIPFLGPMGAVRLGWIDGNIVINPPYSILQDQSNRLDLIMAATPDAICMVEAGARELPDAEMLKTLRAGHEVCRAVAELCEELRRKCAAPAKSEAAAPEVDAETPARLRALFPEQRLRQALLTQGKYQRTAVLDALVNEMVAALAPAGEEEAAVAAQGKVRISAKEVLNAVERAMTLAGQRVDGRTSTEIRPIDIETGLLPRTHGSVLFTRGETQALVTTTLGSADDEQVIDDLHDGENKARFLLHYNFPPYSVGEARPLRGTSRREYGHGALAERALKPVLPAYEEFPYTIRVVSDITESNGSSSMASVCGGCLSLMDAGVPLKAPVAGIAMGLIKDGERFAILSDILGSEDHHGDMDFKVAGTRAGITALQMDIKIRGLSDEIMGRALEQARQGRLYILDRMLAALPAPRAELSRYAPINKFVRIPPDKIGFLIGPKGANIRKLQEDFGVTVAVLNDEGEIQVSGTPVERVDACIETILQQTKELEPGTRIKGRVTSIKSFGCFVDLGGGQEGMCHISELAEGRVNEVEDVVREGDEIEVVIISVSPEGKVRVSRRIALLPAEEVATALESAQAPRGGSRGGPPRDGDRPPRRGGDHRGRDRERRGSPAGDRGRH